MNARNAVVWSLVALCLSPLFASPTSARSASSLPRASWRDARLTQMLGSTASPRTLAFGRGSAANPRAIGPASRVSVPDGAGGLYIAWAEYRDGNVDVFLLRVTNTGTVSSGWPADGRPVCNAAGDQYSPVLVGDGLNGVIVAWLDFRDTWKVPDAYAQRVSSAGAPLWTANGVKVAAGIELFDASVAPDGSNGLLVAWAKSNGVDRDIYATRRTGTGALATGWTAGGVLVSGLAEDQVYPVVTTDGSGGALLAWEDSRLGAGDTHIFAQRLNATGLQQWGPNGIQIDITLTPVSSPSICSDGGSGALLFWDDFAGTEMVVGQHLDINGLDQWTTGGQGVPGTTASQGQTGCIADGLGGAIVGWEEQPALDVSLHAQRLNGLGVQQWGVSGVTVVGLANSQPFLGDVVADGSGGAFFVWEDFRNFATPFATPDIFAQKITPVGVASWTANGVSVSSSGGDQVAPTGAPDGSGGLVVAWQDQRGLDIDIYAQHLSSIGTALLVADGKAVFANPGVQVAQGVIQTDLGGAFLFGNEKRNGQWDIKGRKFNEDGTPPGPSVAICFATGHQSLSAAIDDGAGGAIVAWTDRRAGGEDIYVQRLDGNGNPQWTANGVPVCIASGDRGSPRMVTDGAGGAILAWQDDRVSSDPDVYAQRVDNTGTVKWTTNGVAVCADPGTQYGPALASDGAFGAIIAWTDLRSFLSPAVYAQRLNGNGNVLWTLNGESVATFSLLGPAIVSNVVTAPGNAALILINNDVFDLVTGNITSALYVQKVSSVGAGQWGATGTLVCDATSLCVLERIVEDGSGGAYVAWSDGRNDVFDIYARRVDSGGVAQWAANGVAVCNAAGWQHLGSITRAAGGDLVLAWGDQRAGQADIYAHRISSTGVPVWAANGVLVCGATRGQFFAALAPYKAASPERYFVGWTDNRAGNERYVFLQRLGSGGSAAWAADGVTRTTLALVSASAEPDRVHLVWDASENVATTVYRRRADEEWIPVGQVLADGAGQILFDDREVLAGARYGYRLGFIEGREETFAGEVWVQIPTGLSFTLAGLQPNPASEDLVVSFTLPSDDAATLELLDVSGRRVLERRLTGLPGGRHTVRLDEARPPAGIYFIRLTQKGRSITARAAVVR